MLLLAAGCSGAEQPAAAGTESPSARGPESAAPQAADGPCGLLALADVQRAFPNSKPGQVDRRQEKNGVLTCVWDYPTGRFSIIAGNDAPQPIMEEAKGWTLTFLDPLKPNAERNVRYEKVSGAGDEAIAVVEPADASKGFTQDGAFLVVRKGSQQITLMSTDLARRDRAEALKAFAALGAAVAGRLK